MSDDDLIQAVYERTRSFASINILRAAYEVGQAPLQAKDAEIAALKEDAARLDWVVRQADEFSCSVIVDAPGDGDYCVHGMGNAYGQGKTARAAIDSARAAGDGEGKTSSRQLQPKVALPGVDAEYQAWCRADERRMLGRPEAGDDEILGRAA